MNHPVQVVRPALRRIACGAGLLVAPLMLVVGGCKHTVVQTPEKVRYTSLAPATDMPLFMSGSIYERTVPTNYEPWRVSSYGLVGQLRGTGDTTAARRVREWMEKELKVRGFGVSTVPIYGKIQPSEVLKDPNYAIVRVDALIPPGARQDDWFDVQVSCLPENKTSSLAHGVLFETDLRTDGATKEAPGMAIHILGKAKGPVFVNPGYALYDGPNPTGPARASLRKGTVLSNGKVLSDRPLLLRLRQPERRLSRRIQTRVNERFQQESIGDVTPAQAFDEGLIQVFVPKWYRGDWEHFLAVVTHLYLDSSPEFNASKCKRLVELAQKPGIDHQHLTDISYCWEGIGKDALPFIMPLLTHPSPDVAFAAARAAAFIGDNTGAAEMTLARMARTPGHPDRVSCVQVLGGMPKSSALNYTVRELLNADQASIRIEAFKVLARNGDPSVFTQVIAPADDPRNEKFFLDLVPGDGPPLIYATRRGVPRIAIIGKRAELRLPVSYTAMGNRFTLSSGAVGRAVTLFFRDESRRDERAGARPLAPPVKVVSTPDVAEIVAHLGGAGERGDEHLNFTYAEVIAILQSLADEHRLVASDRAGTWEASFLLEEAHSVERQIENAPVIGIDEPLPGDGGTPRSPAGPGRNSPSLTPMGAPGSSPEPSGAVPTRGGDLTPRQNPSNLVPVRAGSTAG